MTQILIKSPVAPSGSEFMAFDLRPEAASSWGFIQLDFYSSAPGSGGFDFSYPAGVEPINQWYFYERFTEVEHTGIDQIWAKVEKTSVISGTQSATNLVWGQGGTIGAWVDLWDNWELEFSHRVVNGIPEAITIDVSIAKDDGGGAPDLSTVVVYPFTLTAYRGKTDYIIQDLFNGTNGDLANHFPNIDRRDDGAGDVTSGWRNLFWDESQYDNGWMGIQNNVEAESRIGTIPECVFVIDAKVSDFQISVSVEFDVTSGASGGIIGRVQDSGNFWLLAVKNPASSDPVLGLYKVVSGTHTLVESFTMTGLGPLTGLNDAYPMRLSFEGNNITGEMGFSDGSVNVAVYERPYLTHTDATYNTQTDAGLWADGIDTIYQEMSLVNWPYGFDAIVWNTTPLTTAKTDTGSVVNNCYFYESANGKVADPYNSTCGYWDGGTTPGFEDVIDWRAVSFATDVFVLKASAVSGDTAGITIREYGTTPTAFDVWMDLFRCDIEHEVAVSESQSAVIDVTVAIDDGTGNPLAGTEVTKRITFNTTSTGP